MVAAVCVALLATSAAPGPWSEPAAAPADVQPAGQPTAQSPAPPRVSYEDAERMARAGDTLRALEAFRALAAANPDDFDSIVWLGRLLTRVGRRAEAIDLLQDVIARSPRQVDARVALGAALLTSGRVEDAYAVVQDAEALEPNSADVLALKGRILRHLGRPSEALRRAGRAPTRSARSTRTSAIVRERTRRMVAHRAHVSVAQRGVRRRFPRRRSWTPTSTSISTTRCACSAASSGRRGPASTTRGAAAASNGGCRGAWSAAARC